MLVFRSRTPRRVAHTRTHQKSRLGLEALEYRAVPSAVAEPDFVRAHAGTATPNGSTAPYGLTPAQVRSAYGFNAVTFGAVIGDGSGQTIAIVDAYDNPKFVSSGTSTFSSSDLHNFDAAFSLPDPVFTKVNQTGGTTYPTGDTGWGTEIALDVEWAHVVAPKANILLVEANSSSFTDLFAAVNYAKTVAGVSAVSMSWGGGEFSGETSYDSTFTTPAGHAGVTFLASTGDSGAPGGYPAYSSHVVAVGGTKLTLGANNSYGSESGWASGGGGVSTTEAKPSYQSAITLGTRRMIPDVSMDADPNSGVAVYDSYGNGTTAPWTAVGGTSLSAPMWAGLVALADQGRVLAGQGTLDGYTQTLPKLYALPSADFHDVTTGNNGNAAGAGYDLVTGRGTPVANLVANGLIDAVSPPPVSPPPTSPPPVSPPPPPASPPPPSTSSYSATGLPASIVDFTTTISRVTVPTDQVIGKLTVTLTLTHTYDSDLVIQLVSPSGRVVNLSNRHGGSGDNYANTVFDSTATKTIGSAAAPFTGTFVPDSSLGVFNGLDAKGTWSLQVSDVSRLDQGSLKSWTLTVQGTAGAASRAAVVAGSGSVATAPATDHHASVASAPAAPSHGTPGPTLAAAAQAMNWFAPTASQPASGSTSQPASVTEAQRPGTPATATPAPVAVAASAANPPAGFTHHATPAADLFGLPGLHDGVFVG